MIRLLAIPAFCFATISYAQTSNTERLYWSGNSGDSHFRYFLSILDQFDSTDIFKNDLCETASDKIGDYYKYKKDYSRAIAYYDSADAKYINKVQFCGNGYYIYFIPRRYKESQCYLKLNNPKKAVDVITPYIFDSFGASYFDKNMISYYSSILNMLYSKHEIRTALKKAIDGISYNSFYSWTLDSGAKYLNITCKVKIFNNEIEMAGYEISNDDAKKMPLTTTKDFFIKRFKRLEIYKKLYN